MKKAIFIFVVSVVSAIVVYYATLPVPEGIPNPNRLRVDTAFYDMVRTIFPYIPKSMLESMDKLAVTNDHATLNVTETTLDGIPAIFYRPVDAEDTPLPAVIFLHGGGWMYLSIYQSHQVVRNIGAFLNGSAVVISIGYRQAPEHRFPAAIDDLTKGIVWLLRHTDTLKIDKSRVTVIGESAGANLGAAVAQRFTFDSHYKDLPRLRAQVLVNPVLQMFDLKTPSYQQNGHYRTLLISPDWMAQLFSNYIVGNESLTPVLLNNEHITAQARGNEQYAKFVSHDLIPEELKREGYSQLDGEAAGNSLVYNEIKDIVFNPDFSPLMRPDLKGLPEAHIVTCQYDILRDDGIMYAKRLERQNVKTTLRNYKNGSHGQFSFVLSQPLPESSKYDDDLVDNTLLVLKGFIN